MTTRAWSWLRAAPKEALPALRCTSLTGCPCFQCTRNTPKLATGFAFATGFSPVTKRSPISCASTGHNTPFLWRQHPPAAASAAQHPPHGSGNSSLCTHRPCDGSLQIFPGSLCCQRAVRCPLQALLPWYGLGKTAPLVMGCSGPQSLLKGGLCCFLAAARN